MSSRPFARLFPPNDRFRLDECCRWTAFSLALTTGDAISLVCAHDRLRSWLRAARVGATRSHSAPHCRTCKRRSNKGDERYPGEQDGDSGEPVRGNGGGSTEGARRDGLPLAPEGTAPGWARRLDRAARPSVGPGAERASSSRASRSRRSSFDRKRDVFRGRPAAARGRPPRGRAPRAACERRSARPGRTARAPGAVCAKPRRRLRPGARTLTSPICGATRRGAGARSPTQ